MQAQAPPTRSETQADVDRLELQLARAQFWSPVEHDLHEIRVKLVKTSMSVVFWFAKQPKDELAYSDRVDAWIKILLANRKYFDINTGNVPFNLDPFKLPPFTGESTPTAWDDATAPLMSDSMDTTDSERKTTPESEDGGSLKGVGKSGGAGTKSAVRQDTGGVRGADGTKGAGSAATDGMVNIPAAKKAPGNTNNAGRGAGTGAQSTDMSKKDVGSGAGVGVGTSDIGPESAKVQGSATGNARKPNVGIAKVRGNAVGNTGKAKVGIKRGTNEVGIEQVTDEVGRSRIIHAEGEGGTTPMDKSGGVNPAGGVGREAKVGGVRTVKGEMEPEVEGGRDGGGDDDWVSQDGDEPPHNAANLKGEYRSRKRKTPKSSGDEEDEEVAEGTAEKKKRRLNSGRVMKIYQEVDTTRKGENGQILPAPKLRLRKFAQKCPRCQKQGCAGIAGVLSSGAATSFTEILKRYTNYIFPSMAPNRKRELARVWQQWNHLVGLKRKGFGHVRPGTRPDVGELALYCPICPQPNVNLPENWEDDEDQWKFRRYLVADGNFVLNHSIKKKSQDPIWLTDGASYMVERTAYQEHLEGGKEYQEANKNKAKKGYDSTGLVAIACARHGCFAPGGVVDMQKGERQINVDYALCHAIANTGGQSTSGVTLAYDINCQYSVNFRKRVNRAKHLLSLCPITLPMSFVVGLFHVHGHKEDCLARFAATYLPGAGVTSGEILESLWSTLNGAANMTRSMTLAHRSEMLDACMADIPYLIKQLKKAKKSQSKANESFQALNKTASEDQRKEWQADMDEANSGRADTNNNSMDVYNVRTTKVTPKGDVHANLMELEISENEHLGIADWVSSAIDLQEAQIRFLSQLRSQPPADVTESSSKKRKEARKKQNKMDISLLRASQAIIKSMNSLYESADELFAIDVRTLLGGKWNDSKEECVCEGDDDDECFCEVVGEDAALRVEAAEELTPFPLPSALSKLPKGWKRVAEFEKALRVAQANEALEGIRDSVAQKSWHYRANRALAIGKRAKTRGYDAIKEVDKSLRFHMKRYHIARWALDKLGALKDYPMFQPLTRGHTKAVTSIYNPNLDKPTKEPLTWIWTATPEGVAVDNGDHIEELYRVNWIRAKSRHDRWDEEVVMIESEMDWFSRWMSYQRDGALGWTTLDLGDGPKSYAHRQADMWGRVRADAIARFGQGKLTKAKSADTDTNPKGVVNLEHPDPEGSEPDTDSTDTSSDSDDSESDVESKGH
ncbi:hypothetical protein DFP72DRAFT_850109 [Ephemerocybe angulata]|uniref:CxC2-like cysteine cluster KDZ transposase-associated domain-containing protein n=1 Tax=Ephemerocybe angulata TaxID=980116 RepID=A0A8H6HUX1_9AGAR|nr:hypothetical protein DFP72DRAFT_850109 [Tulosesus angulatus]